jgi:hypothetical protein
MSKLVKLKQELTVQGKTFPINTVGKIIDYPGFDDGQTACKPEIEEGNIKVLFVNGGDKAEASFSLQTVTDWLTDTEVVSESSSIPTL